MFERKQNQGTSHFLLNNEGSERLQISKLTNRGELCIILITCEFDVLNILRLQALSCLETLDSL